MKVRFSTLDIIAILPELKAKLCTGWRVNQVYDCDQKTYLFKLNKSIVQMKKDDDPVSVDEVTANKMTFIIESGLRMHTTDYDWPKSHAPNAFATKIRKHIRNKRIEDIRQVGIDRLVDIQFGSGLAASHLMVELYDRGNLVLTDHEYRILAILRWRRPINPQNDTKNTSKQKTAPPTGDSVQDTATAEDSEDFKVGQLYPLSRSRNAEDLEQMTDHKVCELINAAQAILGSSNNKKKRNKVKQDAEEGSVEINLKDLLNPHVIYGSSLLEDKVLKHIAEPGGGQRKRCVIKIPLDEQGRLDQEKVRFYASRVCEALNEADQVMREVKMRSQSPGYIVQKKQKSDISNQLSANNKQLDATSNVGLVNIDFFPLLSCAERKIQLEAGPEELTYQEYESFDRAVDVYYTNLESQRIDSKAFAAEKEAQKKLQNLKISQEKRLEDLAKAQKEDEVKARLIELNSDKVESALTIIRSMLANQIAWDDILDTIKQAQEMQDPIASLITGVKFDRNAFTMRLSDPYDSEPDEDNEMPVPAHQTATNHKKKSKGKKNQSSSVSQGGKYHNIDIDISLSAYANARKFFDKRRTAVNKEKKTIEVSKKAYKNVERRVKEKLKEVVVTTNITKSRKRFWFENFIWFISSDGYLVVAGRDAEQNEQLVKRYMKSNDIYVHADLHGASTVIIKNETSQPVPPKTLVEAGTFAVCYSSAWDSKIATTSWWVFPKQVSKSAPSGEYLTAGAFIIRGKKNYLPLSNLVLGFGFLFRLGDESVERRRDARLTREKDTKMNELEPVESIDNDDAHLPDTGTQSEASDNESNQSSNSFETPPATNNEKWNHDDPEGNATADAAAEDYGDEDDDDDAINNAEHRLIDILSENPLPDDVLLYSIPMCGPYTALQSFKFKVKVVPGTGKRGKAAKTCLGMFLHDKNASQRERDLLRVIKDQDYARNLPGKVKISAANMKSLVKKRPKRSEVRLSIH